MSMCHMPLLIKASMTKENYLSLLKEASETYRKTYLRKHYLFDGKYFTLDTCDMDSFEIFDEAKLIAKYAEPTDKCVGLIFSGGCSYSFDDLYFCDGNYHTVKRASDREPYDFTEVRNAYLLGKKEYLSSFPAPDASGNTIDADVEALLAADIKFTEYRCIGIEPDELDAIFRKHGQIIGDIDRDMGCVSVSLQDEEIDPETILANHFHSDKAYMFCRDGDQDFPNSFMILLQSKPEQGGGCQHD